MSDSEHDYGTDDEKRAAHPIFVRAGLNAIGTAAALAFLASVLWLLGVI